MRQDAVTVSNGAKIMPPTWSVECLGAVGREQMSRGIRDDIGDKVDMFINAYLSVNPK